MTITHSDAGRMSRASRKEMEAKIEALAAKYQPKVIATEIVDGKPKYIIEAAYAEGCRSVQYVKKTGNHGYRELEC